MLLLYLIVSLVIASTLTAGSTALDPEADARLAKPHTLNYPPTPLTDLLQQLSRQTGVALRVDRSVAQHRAILVVHNQPLHQALQKLAEAFGFVWRKVESKGKPAEYMLTVPAQETARQRAEWREVQRLNQQVVQGALAEVLKADVSQLDALRRTYLERRRELHGTPPKARNGQEALDVLKQRFLIEASSSWEKWVAACVLAKLPASAWQQMERGEILQFDTASPESPLPPNFVAVWKRLQQEALETPSDIPVDERWREITARNMQVVDGGYIRLFMHPVSRRLMYGFAMTEAGSPRVQSSSSPLWYSPTEVAYVLEQLLSQGETASEEHALVRQLAQPLTNVELPLTELCDLMGHLLARFAKENRVSLVGEWYPYAPVQVWASIVIKGKETLARVEWETIRPFLSEYGYQLSLDGDYVLVTQRLRTLCRAFEVPESSIRRWLLKRGREGEIDLNDVLEVSALLPAQIMSLMHQSDRLLAYRGSKDNQPAHLREIENHPSLQVALLAIASLPASLRQTVLQGTPVPFTLLPAQAQRYLALAASFQQPILPPLSQTELQARIEERSRPEIPSEGVSVPQEILQRFFSMSYEDFYASLSEQERQQYLRPRYMRELRIQLMQGEQPYLMTGLYWERWGE